MESSEDNKPRTQSGMGHVMRLNDIRDPSSLPCAKQKINSTKLPSSLLSCV